MRSLTTLVVLVLLSLPAAAQGPVPRQPAGTPAAAKPAILTGVGIDQRLNEQVPLDLAFLDENGRQVRLGDYFGRRPVVLALVYYECPMLCTQVLNGLVRTLRVLSFDVGRDFDVVAVSFDPGESPALAHAKKEAYVKDYGRSGTADGWHFLTGDPGSIAKLTRAVGFRYTYDEKIDQFAHGAAITVLTPTGVLSRYFYGIEYAPRDLRLGIVEASKGAVGTIADQVLLLCYHYDPSSGRYSFMVLTLVRIGGLLTLGALGTFFWVERRKVRLKPDTTGSTASR